MRFRILPPWWRTIWLYALYGVAAALLLLFVSRQRTRHLVRQKHHLERIVRKRTSELEASREDLRIQATHDGLTGLLKRSAILELVDKEIERSRRDKSALTIVLADIDNFKQVNDTRGHLAGDEALRRFALALSAAVRPTTTPGGTAARSFYWC